MLGCFSNLLLFLQPSNTIQCLCCTCTNFFAFLATYCTLFTWLLRRDCMTFKLPQKQISNQKCFVRSTVGFGCALHIGTTLMNISELIYPARPDQSTISPSTPSPALACSCSCRRFVTGRDLFSLPYKSCSAST